MIRLANCELKIATQRLVLFGVSSPASVPPDFFFDAYAFGVCLQFKMNVSRVSTSEMRILGSAALFGSLLGEGSPVRFRMLCWPVKGLRRLSKGGQGGKCKHGSSIE